MGDVQGTVVGEGSLGQEALHGGEVVAVAGPETMTALRLEVGLRVDVRGEENLRVDHHGSGGCRQRRRGVDRRWIRGWR